MLEKVKKEIVAFSAVAVVIAEAVLLAAPAGTVRDVLQAALPLLLLLARGQVVPLAKIEQFIATLKAGK